MNRTTTPQTFFGYVEVLSMDFMTYPDGTEKFMPLNTFRATIHPTDEPGAGTYAVELLLKAGEYFQVREETDKSEGRGGTRPAGNYLHYPDALRAAHGKGVQGGISPIVIMSPDGSEETIATDRDGTEIVLDTATRWRSIQLSSRLRFLNR